MPRPGSRATFTPVSEEETAFVPDDPDTRPQRRRVRWIVVAAIALAAGLGGAAIGIAVDRSAGGTSTVTTTLVTTTTVAGAAEEPGSAEAPQPAPAPAAAVGAGTLAQLVEATAPGVVSILSTFEVTGPPLLPGETQEAVAEGSGFVLDEDGRILTSDHMVEGATKIHVSFSDGTKVHATVLATDPPLDLAVLEVEDVPASTLEPLPLGLAADLSPGDTVVAIGNPFGYERSVSVGVVSALEREMVAPNGFTISNAVQTDAPINHGNSGGPLLDTQGRVVGVNAQIADSGVNANVGVGFAVAIDAAALRAIEQMSVGEEVEHAWLGVSIGEIDAILATSGRIQATEGALITGVVEGGPAADAGIAAGSEIVTVDGVSYCLGGDVITAVADREVETAADLGREIARYVPGDTVAVALVHADGAEETVAVELGTQPATAPETTTGCG
jgi:S1-C subfamily serine protease